MTGQGLVALQVLQAKRTAQRFQVLGDAAREVATIKVVQAVMGELVQGGGEAIEDEALAFVIGLAVLEECLGEARNVFQLIELVPAVAGQRLGDGSTVFRMVDRVFEEAGHGQAAVPVVPAVAKGGLPAGNRARDGESGERAAARNGVVILRFIKPDVREAGRSPAGVDPDRIASGLGDEPEIVAAERVHVGIDDGDRGGRCDHRFDGVAAVIQHAKPGLSRQVMGGRDHAAIGAGPVCNIVFIPRGMTTSSGVTTSFGSRSAAAKIEGCGQVLSMPRGSFVSNAPLGSVRRIRQWRGEMALKRQDDPAKRVGSGGMTDLEDGVQSIRHVFLSIVDHGIEKVVQRGGPRPAEAALRWAALIGLVRSSSSGRSIPSSSAARRRSPSR